MQTVSHTTLVYRCINDNATPSKFAMSFFDTRKDNSYSVLLRGIRIIQYKSILNIFTQNMYTSVGKMEKLFNLSIIYNFLQYGRPWSSGSRGAHVSTHEVYGLIPDGSRVDFSRW